MALSDYFSELPLSIMIGSLLGGIPAVAGDHQQKGLLFHAGLALTYISICYFIGGGIVWLTGAGHPVAYALIALLLSISAHVHYSIAISRQKRVAATADRLREESEELNSRLVSAEAGLSTLGRFRSVNIDDVFEGFEDSAFLSHARAKIASAKRVTILFFDPAALLSEHNSQFMRILENACSSGVELVLVHSGDDFDPGAFRLKGKVKTVRVGVELMPEAVFAMLAGGTVYFAIRPGNIELRETPIIVGSPTEDRRSSFPISVRTLVQNALTWTEPGVAYGRVAICDSPYSYHRLVVEAENTARHIDRIPKRISVLFKGDELIEHIARGRFGPGSPNVKEYREEHVTRRELFYASLRAGNLFCREVYNTDELVGYIGTLTHAGPVRIPVHLARDMVIRWHDAIVNWPKNYQVGFTKDRIPFKYHIMDGKQVIMHEAIGSADMHRLNAISIFSQSIAEKFTRDFNTIWERTEPRQRDNRYVAEWISENILPRLQ